MYRLISAAPSPYARKVRVQLAEKDIAFELITEVPWDADTATPRHNPLEKLPVLLLPDGGSVFESRYINEWIEAKHPAPPLVPADVEGRLAVKRWEVIADGACDALVLLFWENARGEGRRSEPWAARQRRKVDGALGELECMLGDATWCHGGRFSQADIAVGSLLGWMRLRWPQFGLDAYPALVRLSERLEQRPSFAASRPAPQSFKDAVV